MMFPNFCPTCFLMIGLFMGGGTISACCLPYVPPIHVLPRKNRVDFEPSTAGFPWYFGRWRSRPAVGRPLFPGAPAAGEPAAHAGELRAGQVCGWALNCFLIHWTNHDLSRCPPCTHHAYTAPAPATMTRDDVRAVIHHSHATITSILPLLSLQRLWPATWTVRS